MWNKIIGQTEVIEKLKAIYFSNKIAHAYLFTGSDGVGKEAVAIEFAMLLNCPNATDTAEACGKCSSCKKISGFKSEYFQFICPMPAGKGEDKDEDPIESLSTADFELYLEELQAKAANSYHRISLPNANYIRINSIRTITRKISLSAAEGAVKFFLLAEADKMRAESANALLKVLEEPPDDSILILTSSKYASLPQTITGRCQRIHFKELDSESIRKKLTNDELIAGKFSSDEIELACSLSNNSYTKTTELLSIGVKEFRNDVVKYLLALLSEKHSEIVAISRKVAGRNKKELVRAFLFLLAVWIKDLMQSKHQQSTENISNTDLIQRLQSFNKNFPSTEFYKALVEIENADFQINQNLNLPSILINLSPKLRAHFH